jgi:uncharacterized coiled-coil protein SlyX
MHMAKQDDMMAQMQAKLDELAAQVGKLQGENDTLRVAANGQPAVELRTPPPLDPKYKGTKRYTLTQPHYRREKYYEPGDIIEVTDEKPGRTWVPYEGPASSSPAVNVLPTVTPAAPSDSVI